MRGGTLGATGVTITLGTAGAVLVPKPPVGAVNGAVGAGAKVLFVAKPRRGVCVKPPTGAGAKPLTGPEAKPETALGAKPLMVPTGGCAAALGGAGV